MQNFKKQSSFTLIELLVVIVIIGILAGVIMVSISNFITQSQNTKITAEISSLSKSLEGYSKYCQGNLCIEDNANNSSFKSSLGIDQVPKNPEYPANGTHLTTNNCFLYFSDGENYSIRTKAVGNNGYIIQESRNPKTKDIVKSCDSGWIPFGNRCIMKYEAKNVSGIATSQAALAPWVSINQMNAKAECEKIGAHLVTNAEWMAIARDIESVSSNWTGTVLNRGHTDSVPANSLAASTDNDPYSGTGQTSGEQKRTHTLSNGEVIWDIAGNVWEWVDDKIECGATSCPSSLMPYDSTPASEWVEFTSVNTWGKYTKAELGPLGNYNSANGVGRIYTDADGSYSNNSPYDNTVHAFLRGGNWGISSIAGVFAVYLNYAPEPTNTGIGFRCAR